MQKRERPKHVRGAAARNQKNKEARNREIQREKERTDTGRRKGRIRQDDGIGFHLHASRPAELIRSFRVPISNS